MRQGDGGVLAGGEVLAEELSLSDVEERAVEPIIEVAVCSWSQALRAYCLQHGYE